MKQSMKRKTVQPNEEPDDALFLSRRQALKAIGLGGLAFAGALAVPDLASAAAKIPSNIPMDQKESTSVANTKALREIPSSSLKDGMMVSVLGALVPGDAGARTVVYLKSSAGKENGGTVHKPKDGGAGAWHVVHNGIGRFAWFGIFDASSPADSALDALVTDPSFHLIEADSDLLLVKRHRFSRSNLDLDFKNHTMYTYGAENANRDDPFAAMMFFRGKEIGEPFTVTLPGGTDDKGNYKTLSYGEDTEYLYVGNNSGFAENQWYFVQSNPRPLQTVEGRMPIGGGSSDIEIQKLLMVTKVGNALGDTHYAAFNYVGAWPLASGRKLTFQRIEPVSHVNVRNLKFEGQGHSDTTGTSPVAHEFCVDCSIETIEARKVFWPLDIRRYCTTYSVKNCKLINPEEVKTGGTGYMVQQIGCLYGHVSDCQAHNVRHLNDFTGCAYSIVENCHCTGDENGAFVTHGQYDHDLTYIGNSGFLSFANSALNQKDPHNWGGWHKRITVKKHIAPRVVFQNKMNRVVDMTLEDCYVYRNTARYGGNGGSVWANVDGLNMRGCNINGSICLGEDSSISARPTVIEDCTFSMTDGDYITRHRGSKYEVEKEITFRNCIFNNIGENFIVKGTVINFYQCHFYPNKSAAKNRLNIEAKQVNFIGGGIHGVCFAFDRGGTTSEPVGAQSIKIAGGAVIEGNNTEGSLFEIRNNALITFDFGDAVIRPDKGCEIITLKPEADTVVTGPLALRADGTTFENTVLKIPASAMGTGSYAVVQSCLLKNSALDLPAGNVMTGNNLTIS